ncbi:MarR family winged helix-turn-helix transcriptional regulator [Saccharothrix xinjiangensis]|uniref:MarR family winged helix-turn-helix transcriptional regulator n=1 Tax=Saccharothrix xinjiangensis TaxID=204798 RepID=A0ABV9Y6G0_9PSEU
MPDDLGLLLFLPHRELENRVFAALAEAGFDDVTPAQARVFRRIGRDGSRLAELAEAAQVARPTAGFLVDQLERAGYVERTSDPTDARARLIRVTERGLAACSVGLAATAEVEREWTAHLGARRMAALRDALGRLGEITAPCP